MDALTLYIQTRTVAAKIMRWNATRLSDSYRVLRWFPVPTLC